MVASLPPSGEIVVESIQTISRRIANPPSERWGGFSLVIIDEAHHALAKTYQMLWTAWPEAKFLGLTATPYRMSGDGFRDLFEVLVDSWSVKRFIAEGWLSTYDYYSIRPDSEEQMAIDSLKKRGADGDFQMKELRAKLDVRPSIERLFESFERFAFDKKGIIYAIDIAHAEHIAEYYREQGVGAYAISSMTPLPERKCVIEAFRNSTFCENSPVPSHPEERLQVLVSVDLFSEGFDCPDVEFIQLARPTLSLTKYLQMVGRGLRPCKGKEYCTIIDNVGLYRAFGLPSVDRDWETYFEGIKDERNIELKNDPNLNFLGFNNDFPSDGRNDNIVKIVSHEGQGMEQWRKMQSQLAKLDKTGFERRKKGKVWVWIDLMNGVEFDRHPKVINYRGMEMSTADGDTFFPRISSKWIDGKHGISRNALETQVGDGIVWMKLYISFAMPGKVMQLQSIKPNLARIYKDEQGMTWLQQDLDHAPVREEEAGGRKEFMTLCDKELQAWEEMKRSIRKSTLKYDHTKRWWQIPEGSVKELQMASIYHIIYKENGENKEFWVDGPSGFTYRHRPVMRKRGFVELLCDGEVVYIQNIRDERFLPYRNWEIRADEHICVIGNKLYLKRKKDEGCYRIKKRSDDFRMFIVEDRYPKRTADKIEYDELMIINKAGADLEIKKM